MPKPANNSTLHQRRRWSPTALRALRKRRGWSQQDLAHALGVHVATVGRWEAGLTDCPSPMAMQRLDRLNSHES